jgi:hypothetical protein
MSILILGMGWGVYVFEASKPVLAMSDEGWVQL